VVSLAFEATKTQSQRAGTTAGTVGLFLHSDGKLKDSERLNARSYDILQKFGEDHPDTLTRMSNLALTYRNQGKLEDDADLNERVLEAWERTLGEEHPDTLTSMSYLAWTYEELGRERSSRSHSKIGRRKWKNSRRRPLLHYGPRNYASPFER
jgi:hypothetical protein